MSLVLCANCDRHIRHNETSCPFCDAPHTPHTPHTTLATQPKKGWIQPLSRAAIVFFGASAITAVASACGDKEGPPPNTPTADPGSPSSTTTTSPTTPPPARDGGMSENQTPHPAPVALYGVAPINK